MLGRSEDKLPEALKKIKASKNICIYLDAHLCNDHIKNKKTLIISPDGELNKVPFAAIGSFNNSDLLSDIFKLRIITTGRELIMVRQLKFYQEFRAK